MKSHSLPSFSYMRLMRMPPSGAFTNLNGKPAASSCRPAIHFTTCTAASAAFPQSRASHRGRGGRHRGVSLIPPNELRLALKAARAKHIGKYTVRARLAFGVCFGQQGETNEAYTISSPATKSIRTNTNAVQKITEQAPRLRRTSKCCASALRLGGKATKGGLSTSARTYLQVGLVPAAADEPLELEGSVLHAAQDPQK